MLVPLFIGPTRYYTLVESVHSNRFYVLLSDTTVLCVIVRHDPVPMAALMECVMFATTQPSLKSLMSAFPKK